MTDTVQHFQLDRAVLCVSCDSLSDSNTDDCPACGAKGSLFNLSRILNPNPKLGQVTHYKKEGEESYAKADSQNKEQRRKEEIYL
jgi:hypothetical protein